MKLLIVTQKVDRTDPILGFFHRWLLELAKDNTITVIGQQVGDHDLPGVKVLSLGKEYGTARFIQIFRFWWLIIRHRRDYDAVLVHMTPVWLVLGAKTWFLLRKRAYLWYEARGGGVWLKLSAVFARKIFSASASGMPFRTPKQVVVGHGIDTERFRPGGERRKGLLITVGRITMAKHVERMINALATLPADARLRIAGLPLTKTDRVYEEMIDKRIHDEGLMSRVERGALPPDQVVPLLQSAAVFLHASETALDKALLEAMACGCPVVSCATAVQEMLPEVCRSAPAAFGGQVRAMLDRSDAERAAIGTQLRGIVERDHSLPRLAARLVAEMGVR